jgi:hypothetical protein
MNPLQWTNVSSDYGWAYDHDGQGQNLLIDGTTAYLGNTFKGSSDYSASMTRLDFFFLQQTVQPSTLSPSKRLKLGQAV